MARGKVRVEQGTRRVRAFLGGHAVVDSTSPLLVWEIPYYPTYHFRLEDFADGTLIPTGETKRSPSRGEAILYDVAINGNKAEGAAYGYEDSPIEELIGTVAIKWAQMDHWFEEDDEVYFHARDPYTRVDILQSSRHIEVKVDGVTIAESTQPRMLFETNLPTRYYLPKTDVRFDLLTPTDTSTACPYKGTARYWSVTVDGTTHDDIVWGYDSPLRESELVTGYVCFYNEKVDVYVDGDLENRPKTKFS